MLVKMGAPATKELEPPSVPPLGTHIFFVLVVEGANFPLVGIAPVMVNHEIYRVPMLLPSDHQ